MIRKIGGRVGNSVRIPVVVSFGCRALGRVSEPPLGPASPPSQGSTHATRAVARRQSATGETTDAARSVRAGGGEIADRDLVGMYLDEIARTPLLDAAKEVELSQIEAGVFARQILDDEVDAPQADATREELEALVAEGSGPRTSSSAPT